jgi:hypothetical protein
MKERVDGYGGLWIGQRSTTSVEVSYNNELPNNLLPCPLVAMFDYVNII